MTDFVKFLSSEKMLKSSNSKGVIENFSKVIWYKIKG